MNKNSSERPKPTLKQMLAYFLKLGAWGFGGPVVLCAHMRRDLVETRNWITPGPAVITVGFIGYLVSGLLGGLVAALGVFLPCYLFVIIPTPYFSRIAKNITIKAFVDGVTSAAIGAIAGAAMVLGRRALVDWPTVLLALATLASLIRFKRIPEPVLILAAGAAGIIWTGI